MKKGQIIDGKIVFTFNGNARLEFVIPPQIVLNELVFVKDIKQVLEKALE
jgi:hypothetical protein